MNDHPATLLQDIEAFVAETGMAESTFGRRAVSDWKLITQLRGGRRLWPDTMARIRAFMATVRADRAAKGEKAEHPAANNPDDAGRFPHDVVSDAETPAVITCSVCDRRLDGAAAGGCAMLDCPRAEREAA